MRIFLIGFMGCGKSTIGKKLAKTLSCKFIDLDNYIERKTGESIQQIFKKKEEKYFRV
jgi:shikimate kinase